MFIVPAMKRVRLFSSLAEIVVFPSAICAERVEAGGDEMGDRE
jgi:hypothetical protein